MVLTVRRRRKRAAGPPPLPTRQQSLSSSTPKARSASTDGLRSTPSSYENCGSFDPGARARSLDDPETPEPVSIGDVNGELNISSDDVFADSNTPADRVTHIALPGIRFQQRVLSQSSIHNRMEQDPEKTTVVSEKEAPNHQANYPLKDIAIHKMSQSEYNQVPLRTNHIGDDLVEKLKRKSSTSTLVDEVDVSMIASHGSAAEMFGISSEQISDEMTTSAPIIGLNHALIGKFPVDPAMKARSQSQQGSRNASPAKSLSSFSSSDAQSPLPNIASPSSKVSLLFCFNMSHKTTSFTLEVH